MEIRYKENIIFIADDSDIALKIIEVYDFSLDEKNRIIIGSMGVGLNNKYQMKKAIEKAKIIDDLKEILTAIMELI